MRRTPLVIAALAVTPSLLLGGCSEERGGSTSSSQGPAAQEPSEIDDPGAPESTEPSDAALDDTWADVEDPATMEVPLESVEGVKDVRVWEGSRFRQTPSAVIVAVPTTDRADFQTLTLGSSTTRARETSQEEAEYWARSSGLLKGRAKVLDPVVVDGLELQHARGSNEVEIVDGYLYADGEISFRVIFTTPLDYTEAQRDEAIAQVMATLEFE